MWQYLAGALVAGLCVGPACVLHCGVLHLAYVGRCASADTRRTLALGVLVMAGRLAAYVLLGAFVGAIAGAGLPLPAPWLLTGAAAVLLLVYAGFPDRHVGACLCRRLPATFSGGALALGFLTGLAPCPPLLASGVMALEAHGLLPAILSFVAFFAGSSVFLLPAVFGVAAVPARWRAQLQRPSRWLSAAVGLATLVLAAAQLPRVSADDAGVGAPAAAAPPLAAAAAGQTAAAIPPPAPASVKPLYAKQKLTSRLSEDMVRNLQLSLHEAKYYRKLDQGQVQCQLCPRGCILSEGERGLCRIRANIGGTLRALTYALPVSIHADPIEKKPLFHVLPGSTALSLATVGCNSGCVFCQNYEISQASPEDVPRKLVPPARLVAAAVERGDAGIAYTYTEPTVFFEYMLETATLAKAKGLRNYWITCGQIREEPLVELCHVLDAANVDLKGFSDEFYVEYCDFHLEPVLRTLQVLKREGVHTEITNLLIPGANDDPAMVRAMCRWIKAELGPETPLHFSRFHPDYKLVHRPPTPAATLARMRGIALEEGLKYVYVGNAEVEGASDTPCPACGHLAVRRSGFLVTADRIKNGKCPDCGAVLRGIW
jgi:pyruvate formate lyase activating enzyme